MVEERTFYPDTNYIYGAFKKRAQEFKRKLKPRKRFKDSIKDESQRLIDKKIKFIISELTEFEIKSKLRNEEGLTFKQANEVFWNRIKECPIYTVFPIKAIKLTSHALNEAVKNNLELKDLLHILIATELKLYLITKEEKILERWKKMYKFVFTPKEFQEQLEKITKA